MRVEISKNWKTTADPVYAANHAGVDEGGESGDQRGFVLWRVEAGNILRSTKVVEKGGQALVRRKQNQ